MGEEHSPESTEHSNSNVNVILVQNQVSEDAEQSLTVAVDGLSKLTIKRLQANSASPSTSSTDLSLVTADRIQRRPDILSLASASVSCISVTSADSSLRPSDSKSAATSNLADELDEQLAEALKNPKDRAFVLSVADQVEQFLRDDAQGRLSITTNTSYQRLLVHRCATFFNLLPESDSIKVISLYRSSTTILPSVRLGDLVPLEEETPSPVFQLLRRSSTARPSRGSRHTSSDGDGSDVGGKKAQSHAEREAAYLQARSRIFEGFEQQIKSPQESDQNLVPHAEYSPSDLLESRLAYLPAHTRNLAEYGHPGLDTKTLDAGLERMDSWAKDMPYPPSHPSHHPYPYGSHQYFDPTQYLYDANAPHPPMPSPGDMRIPSQIGGYPYPMPVPYYSAQYQAAAPDMNSYYVMQQQHFVAAAAVAAAAASGQPLPHPYISQGAYCFPYGAMPTTSYNGWTQPYAPPYSAYPNFPQPGAQISVPSSNGSDLGHNTSLASTSREAGNPSTSQSNTNGKGVTQSKPKKAPALSANSHHGKTKQVKNLSHRQGGGSASSSSGSSMSYNKLPQDTSSLSHPLPARPTWIPQAGEKAIANSPLNFGNRIHKEISPSSTSLVASIKPETGSNEVFRPPSSQKKLWDPSSTISATSASKSLSRNNSGPSRSKDEVADCKNSSAPLVKA